MGALIVPFFLFFAENFFQDQQNDPYSGTTDPHQPEFYNFSIYSSTAPIGINAIPLATFK